MRKIPVLQISRPGTKLICLKNISPTYSFTLLKQVSIKKKKLKKSAYNNRHKHQCKNLDIKIHTFCVQTP